MNSLDSSNITPNGYENIIWLILDSLAVLSVLIMVDWNQPPNAKLPNVGGTVADMNTISGYHMNLSHNYASLASQTERAHNTPASSTEERVLTAIERLGSRMEEPFDRMN